MTLSKHDLRQLRLMEKKIYQFEHKKINLFELVGDLRTILNALETVNGTWKDDFQEEINTLEIISDSIEDGSISKLKEDPGKFFHDSTSKLKKMATLLLEKYLKIPDPSILEKAIILDTQWLMCPKCTDAWDSISKDAMVICPKCEHAFHNPRYNASDKNG